MNTTAVNSSPIQNQAFMEIQGVQFFPTASSCISHFEKAFWMKKAMSLISSFGTLFVYILYKTYLIFFRVEAQMSLYANIDPTSLTKKRLVVCMHGRNDNPSQFKAIVDEMHKKDLSETAIFIPQVLQKGTAKLDEMVSPILEQIIQWASGDGEKELVLVGISNGGRISRAIEAKLAHLEYWGNIKKLRAVSIAGACKGSSLVNLAKKLRLSCLISKNTVEELATDSVSILKLDQQWREGLTRSPGVRREYAFVASPHDWVVPDYDSTLPEVFSQNVRYAIVPNHGHNSIVTATAGAVAELIHSPF